MILEGLRAGYRWASQRLHQFVLEGMVDNSAHFAAHPTQGVRYLAHIEQEAGDGSGLLEALSSHAAVVVGDDFPSFFLPRMSEQAAKKMRSRFEVVDSNGLYPMYATDRIFTRAFSLRRHLQKELPTHLAQMPARDPLEGLESLGDIGEALSTVDLSRWKLLGNDELNEFDLDSITTLNRRVRAAESRGGFGAAEERLDAFVRHRLSIYGECRSHPDEDAASGLSPWLHFGHLSAHRIWAALTEQEDWDFSRIVPKVTGSRDGFWGMTESAESFVDEFVTWREIGFNACAHLEGYDQFDSLPEWAKKTLAEHEGDRREYVYSLEAFERAETHDPIWNAAQRELVETGRMHNYLRMLWGKKILHWTAKPRDALAIMIELNNKYALDGRNPNSYSGIFWVLGRYDRAWGPERPIFGKIRYMTSESTKRKLRMREYLSRWGQQPSLL